MELHLLILIAVLGVILSALCLRRMIKMATDITALTAAETAEASAVQAALAEFQALTTQIAGLAQQIANANNNGDAAAIADATAKLTASATALTNGITAAQAAAAAASPPAAPAAPAAPALTISPATLPNATLGEAYSEQLEASGGAAPYHFSTADLPAGLSLGDAGLITGTPTAAGDTQVAFEVHDNNGASGQIAIDLTVIDPAAAAAAAANDETSGEATA